MTHLLIIESDILLGQLFSRMLNYANYTATYLTCYHQAVNHGHSTTTIVSASVLLEMRLPDGSGFEVITQLRQLARWKHTPIIVMSDSRRF